HRLLRCTCPLSGVKRTLLFATHLSAFDPKRDICPVQSNRCNRQSDLAARSSLNHVRHGEVRGRRRRRASNTHHIEAACLLTSGSSFERPSLRSGHLRMTAEFIGGTVAKIPAGVP